MVPREYERRNYYGASSSQPYPHQAHILPPRAYPFLQNNRRTKAAKEEHDSGHPAISTDIINDSTQKQSEEYRGQPKRKLSQILDDALPTETPEQPEIPSTKKGTGVVSSNTPAKSVSAHLDLGTLMTKKYRSENKSVRQRPVDQFREPQRRHITTLSMKDLDKLEGLQVQPPDIPTPSKYAMKDFERLRESKIRLLYELDAAREEAAAFQRDAEEARHQLHILQHSPSVASSTRSIYTVEDVKDDIVEVQHRSPPLTRADLSVTEVSQPINQTTPFKEEDNFRQRHEADMADLRSQLLELEKSHLQSSIGMSSSTATASYSTPNVPAVTTVLAYPSKSDAPNITRWSSS